MLRRSRIAVATVALSVTTFALAAYAGSLSSLGTGTAEVHAEASGLGKFDGKVNSVSAKESDGKLVFVANLTEGMDMGIRDSDTRKKFKISTKEEVEKDEKKPTRATLIVDKSKLTFPENGKEAKGTVPGTLKLAGGSTSVDVTYKVSRTGSDYHVKEASFSFDYTKIVPKICLPGGLVCVKPPVTIKLKQMKLRDRG